MIAAISTATKKNWMRARRTACALIWRASPAPRHDAPRRSTRALTLSEADLISDAPLARRADAHALDANPAAAIGPQ